MGDVEKDGMDSVDGGWTCVSQVCTGSYTAGQGWPGLRLDL